MKRKMWKKLLCLTLAAVLFVLAFPVLAEETAENEAKYQAYASVALKVRREPRKDSSGKGSIPKDSLVSILELLDSGWARIVFGEGEGYVQTQYLQAMTSMDGSPVEPEPTVEPGTPDESGFREAYQAYALNQAAVYEEANTGCLCIRKSSSARWTATGAAPATMAKPAICSVILFLSGTGWSGTLGKFPVWTLCP